MAFGFSKTRFSPIAIDFGVDSVKLLQIIPDDPPQLVAAGAVVIPEDARSNPQAREAFLVEALKGLFKSQPFKGRRAICSLPAFQTLAQHFEFPRDEEDLSEQVNLQLRQRLNVNPDRMIVRHFPLGQVVRNGVNMQEVLCLAASRDAIMQYIEIARRCKIDIVGMHSEPIAILRAFGHLIADRDQQRNVCFIDIGAATSKVVIAHGANIAFAKTIHAGGDQLTRHLAHEQQISFDEARQLRVSGRAPEPAVAAAVGTGGGSTGLATLDAQHASVSKAPSQLLHAPEHQGSTEVVECLIDELQLCMRYYQSVHADKPIEKLIFLGGESRNIKTCQNIARSVRTAAQLGDPLARMARISQSVPPTGVDFDQPQPGWAVPLGLCLSQPNL